MGNRVGGYSQFKPRNNTFKYYFFILKIYYRKYNGEILQNLYYRQVNA